MNHQILSHSKIQAQHDWDRPTHTPAETRIYPRQDESFDMTYSTPYSGYPNHRVNLPPSYNNVVLNPHGHTVASEPRVAAPSKPHAVHEKLVAIPATGHNVGAPILRAWPPALEGRGISKVDFLNFIDRLNRVTVNSPPIQVLGLAGNIVGMVPLATAQIVGSAVNASTMVAGVAVRKGQTEMLLREVNRDMFNPLGLSVKLTKMEAVAAMARIPIVGPDGKIDKSKHILPPLDNGDGLQQPVGVHQRRLMALQPYISPLVVEGLPDIETPSNFLSKMHGSVSARQASKEEQKMMKKREKPGKPRQDEEEKALRKVIFLVVERIQAGVVC